MEFENILNNYSSILNIIKYYADKLDIMRKLKSTIIFRLKNLPSYGCSINYPCINISYKKLYNTILNEYDHIIKYYHKEIIEINDVIFINTEAIDLIIIDICRNIIEYKRYYFNFAKDFYNYYFDRNNYKKDGYFLLKDILINNVYFAISYANHLKKSHRKRMKRKQRKIDRGMIFAACYFMKIAPVIVKILQQGILKMY